MRLGGDRPSAVRQGRIDGALHHGGDVVAEGDAAPHAQRPDDHEHDRQERQKADGPVPQERMEDDAGTVDELGKQIPAERHENGHPDVSFVENGEREWRHVAEWHGRARVKAVQRMPHEHAIGREGANVVELFEILAACGAHGNGPDRGRERAHDRRRALRAGYYPRRTSPCARRHLRSKSRKGEANGYMRHRSRGPSGPSFEVWCRRSGRPDMRGG
jgi:hypothetical protein